MKHLYAAIVAVLISTPVVAQTALTDDQVTAAIALGTAAKHADDLLICPQGFVGSRAAGFRICLEGPVNRIAFEAFTAKANYKTLRVGDVSEKNRSGAWTITALAHRPSLDRWNGWQVTPPATEVIVQPKGQKETTPCRAVSFELVPEAWSNALGAKFEGQSITATFDPATLPSGDLDVIVLTDLKEYRYTISAKDRARVR